MKAWAAIRRLSAWDWVHRWSSLVCTLFLLLLCLTGLPLIFRHEIDAALHVKLLPGAWNGTRAAASADQALAAAEARFPASRPLFMSHDRRSPEIWYVTLLQGEEGLKQAAVDARSAETLGELHVGDEGLMGIIDSLHTDLFAGLKGKLFLGCMGLLFLVSLVSGAVLYAPFLRGRRFGAVRRGRGAKSRWLDLHNLLGIATLIWCAVVGITGVINTGSDLLLGAWRSQVLARLESSTAAAAPGQGLQTAIDAAARQLPGEEIAFIAFPGASFSSASHYGIYFRGREPLTERLVRPVFVDAGSGAVSAVPRVPWYLTALFLSEPLHFGDYGGLPLKILWAAFDLVAIVVLASGVYLWLVRK